MPAWYQTGHKTVVTEKPGILLNSECGIEEKRTLKNLTRSTNLLRISKLWNYCCLAQGFEVHLRGVVCAKMVLFLDITINNVTFRWKIHIFHLNMTLFVVTSSEIMLFLQKLMYFPPISYIVYCNVIRNNFFLHDLPSDLKASHQTGAWFPNFKKFNSVMIYSNYTVKTSVMQKGTLRCFSVSHLHNQRSWGRNS